MEDYSELVHPLFFLKQHPCPAFDHIRQKCAHLVFGLDHSAALRMLPVKVYGIESTFGSADSATNASVRIHDRSSATKTSCRLLADLLLCESEMILFKSILPAVRSLDLT